MAKQLLAFVALLVLQGVTSSVAAPKSSGSTSFDEWLSTFDPSTAVASKLISCVGKDNGFYPGADPDTCSAPYTACVAGTAYAQSCSSGQVFDSTTQVCADRYAAKSTACATYPAPACSADNVGVYEPTAKCSDLYYICLSATGQPNFQTCTTGDYFNPLTRVCEPQKPGGVDVDACKVPPPPPTVPAYGCSDKVPDNAYATSACSVSFYTCATTSAQPTPRSCSTYGTGTVFDYKVPAALPASSLCIPRSDVSECASSLLASV